MKSLQIKMNKAGIFILEKKEKTTEKSVFSKS